MNTSKVYIQDKDTKEFYCIEMTAINAAGEPTCGDNDFPFWSADINEGYDFSNQNTMPGKRMAEIEMQYNDFSNRNCEIIEL